MWRWREWGSIDSRCLYWAHTSAISRYRVFVRDVPQCSSTLCWWRSATAGRWQQTGDMSLSCLIIGVIASKKHPSVSKICKRFEKWNKTFTWNSICRPIIGMKRQFDTLTLPWNRTLKPYPCLKLVSQPQFTTLASSWNHFGTSRQTQPHPLKYIFESAPSCVFKRPYGI